MSNKIVVANWKMKLSIKDSVALAEKYKTKFNKLKGGEVVACPSPVITSAVADELKDGDVKLGAQNVFWEDFGPYTGETCPQTLVDMGCEYVIVGHSERRKHLLENYSMIHKKVKAVLNVEGLTPIVCIGEEMEEKKSDKRDFVLIEQMQSALSGLNIVPGQNIIVAYEPVWAIGSGITIKPEEAEYAHKIIKLTLNDIFGPQIASENFRIIYGGSISSDNVDKFSGLEGVDGLLVGGASMKVDEFNKIVQTILKA